MPFGWALDLLKHQGFAVAFGCVVLWKGSSLLDAHLDFMRSLKEQQLLQTTYTKQMADSLQAIETSNQRQEVKLEAIRGAVQESEENRLMEHGDIMKAIRDK